MSVRLAARPDNDTSMGNTEPIRIPTCSFCHRDFTEFDNIGSEFCEDHQDYLECPGCFVTFLNGVEVAGESYCRECAVPMLREMAEAMTHA